MMIKRPKIVCMGDSLTEGYGISQADCWCSLLQKEMSLEMVNSGISGDTTGGMLARFQPMVIDHNPSHVIILGGTNDLWYGHPDAQIIANILAMTRHARHHEISAIIGIPTPFFDEMTPPDTGLFMDTTGYRERIEGFQERLRQFATKDGLPTIDFSIGMEPSLFMADGLHPNEAGHQVMAQQAKAVLEVVLE